MGGAGEGRMVVPRPVVLDVLAQPRLIPPMSGLNPSFTLTGLLEKARERVVIE
jgi:hypothetical protein